MRKLKYLSICLLSALALTACEDDPTVINPDPGRPSTAPDGTASSKAMLSSDYCPSSDIVIFNIGDPENEDRDPSDLGRSDKVRVVLPQPLDHDMTLRIGMEPDYANNVTASSGGSYIYIITDGFMKAHNLNVEGYNKNNQGLIDELLINGSPETYITIKAGETVSDEIELFFKRENLRKGTSYLFPIKATDTSTGEDLCELNYVIRPSEETMISTGEKDFVAVSYIDTEVMQPLIAKYLSIQIKVVKRTGRKRETTQIYDGRLIDILNIRSAYIKLEQDKIALSLTEDLQHVLKNKDRYIVPIQKDDIKVCLCVKGGGTGAGFSNLTANQIAEFVTQLKVAIDMYGLDGINLWDDGAGYDKDGAAPVNGESFAKLIKAIKTAMPDKLLTLVDTRETTEALCDPVAGISVGDYLDYAWSSLDDFLAPYESNATLRPLAKVPENKYGTIFMHDIMDLNMDQIMNIGEFFENMETALSGTDVVVSMDIPFYDYRYEGDIWMYPWTFAVSAKHPEYSDGTSTYTTSASTDYTYTNHREYYAFKKDW